MLTLKTTPGRLTRRQGWRDISVSRDAASAWNGADLASWVTTHDSPGRNVFGHHCAEGNHRVVADGDSSEHGGPRRDPDVLPDLDRRHPDRGRLLAAVALNGMEVGVHDPGIGQNRPGPYADLADAAEPGSIHETAIADGDDGLEGMGKDIRFRIYDH